MNASKFYIALFVALSLLGSTAHSALVSIDFDFSFAGTTESMWGFDYVLQQLTIIEVLSNPEALSTNYF